MRKIARPIKFGRFSYAKDFAYGVGHKYGPIFGWLTAEGAVYNCIEVNGLAEKGNIAFNNIDAEEVRRSNGPVCVASRSTGPFMINWWDCRKNVDIDSCCR